MSKSILRVVLISYVVISLYPVYPELVRVVGSTVPDYQGVFLRGYRGQISYHYGAVGHLSAGLGELQGDAIRKLQVRILPKF